MTDPIDRAKVLLRAAHALIQQIHDSCFVEDVTSMTVFYDEADCDGLCLKGDIENWFEGEANEQL